MHNFPHCNIHDARQYRRAGHAYSIGSKWQSLPLQWQRQPHEGRCMFAKPNAKKSNEAKFSSKTFCFFSSHFSSTFICTELILLQVYLLPTSSRRVNQMTGEWKSHAAVNNQNSKQMIQQTGSVRPAAWIIDRCTKATAGRTPSEQGNKRFILFFCSSLDPGVHRQEGTAPPTSK